MILWKLTANRYFLNIFIVTILLNIFFLQPVLAANITLSVTASSPYQFTNGGLPIASVTINQGDTVTWDSGLNANNHNLYISNPVTGNCSQNFANGTFPNSVVFSNPGWYQIHSSPDSSCGTAACTNCSGMAATIVVEPPANWLVNTSTSLSNGSYNLTSLHVVAGNTLTITGAVTLAISGNVAVDSGATILGSGQGFAGCIPSGTPTGIGIDNSILAVGPGSGNDGNSATGGGSGGGGGGHAGLGGNGIASDDSGGGSSGAQYDSLPYPSLPGSGGGCGIAESIYCAANAPGGNGGAALLIQTFTGTVALNGVLDFSGTNGGYGAFCSSPAIVDDWGGGGGGSGGTVNIAAQTLSGTGLINTNGGSGYRGEDNDGDATPTTDGSGGGGSGGYVALCYTNTNSFSGTVSIQGGLDGNNNPSGAVGIYSISLCLPTPTFTNTNTITPTNTPTFTSTNTSTPTLTNTPTYTPSATPSFTNTLSPTKTNTPTVTDTTTSTNTPTNTPSVTPTFTPTNTFTPTQTATFTPTYTPSPTYTPTCVTYVWPDPYNPKTAVGGTLRISCMNSQTQVLIYTLSGELVQTLDQSTSCQVPDMWGTVYCWNGRNKMGFPVASGIYLYVVEQNNQVTLRGKFLMMNGS